MKSNFSFPFDAKLAVGCILLTEELAQFPLAAPFLIFLGSHQDRGVQIRTANLRTYQIVAQRVVVFGFLLDIVRHAQVNSSTI